jgi:hypothetical protein
MRSDARKRIAESPTRVLTDSEKELAAVILARFEARSEHTYMWPRWAAAEEAAQAVSDYLAIDHFRVTTDTATEGEKSRSIQQDEPPD